MSKKQPNEYTDFQIATEFGKPREVRTYADRKKYLYFDNKVIYFERVNNNPYWTLMYETGNKN